MLLTFLKGPLGMAMLGTVITAATAVTGVAAGPSMAKAVAERVNATAMPTTVAAGTPSPAAKGAGAAKPAASPVAAAARTTPSPAPRGTSLTPSARGGQAPAA